MSDIKGGLILRKGNIILKEDEFFIDKAVELNLNRMFEKEQYLIYVSSNDNYSIHMYSINNKVDKKLNSDMSWQVYVNDKYIYYCKMLEWDNLYKIRMDTMEIKRVNYDSTYNMKVVDDKIYYRNESEAGGIFRLDMQGENKRLVTEDIADEININGEFLYYRNRMDEGKLYRVSLDGTKQEKLNETNTRGITFDRLSRDIVYYSNEDDGGCLYRINLAEATVGTDKVYEVNKLSDFKVRGTIVSENHIYCRNEDDGGGIYRIDKTNCEAVKIKGGDYAFVGLEKGYMYLIDKVMDVIVRVSLEDGTEEVVLKDIGKIYDVKIV